MYNIYICPAISVYVIDITAKSAMNTIPTGHTVSNQQSLRDTRVRAVTIQKSATVIYTVFTERCSMIMSPHRSCAAAMSVAT